MVSNPEEIPYVYSRLLEFAIVDLRCRIRYDDEVTISEVHDLMDALHNIPKMIRKCDGWHVPGNIDVDLAGYDDKWIGSDNSEMRQSLLRALDYIRQEQHKHIV